MPLAVSGTIRESFTSLVESGNASDGGCTVEGFFNSASELLLQATIAVVKAKPNKYFFMVFYCLELKCSAMLLLKNRIV
jgi:hypothetical protein